MTLPTAAVKPPYSQPDTGQQGKTYSHQRPSPGHFPFPDSQLLSVFGIFAFQLFKPLCPGTGINLALLKLLAGGLQLFSQAGQFRLVRRHRLL